MGRIERRMCWSSLQDLTAPVTLAVIEDERGQFKPYTMIVTSAA